MIRNVIFDFGQVLIKFIPEHMVSPYVSDTADRKMVEEVLFDRLYWDRLDAGTISDEEVVKLASERLPKRLHEPMKAAYENWYRNLPEIPGMHQLVKKLKAKGVRVFLISNISKGFAEHAGEFAVIREMEECIFSASVGLTKPSGEIFELLLKKASINAAESIFIDDSEKNIRGAESVGIKGYLFDGNALALEKYLDRII